MVVNKWNDKDAAIWVENAGSDPADQVLALQVYASRLIGSDPTLVQHGGGNTSCKTTRCDVFGEKIQVIHIKGSGADLACVNARDLPGVRLEPLRALRKLEEINDQDMVNLLRCNLLDATAPNPSVETLLHAYLAAPVVNHTHATAMLALANLRDAASVVTEIFGDALAIVPFQMPGYALGKAAALASEANPNAKGLLLLNHGYVGFAGDPRSAYDLTIEHTNMVQDWFDQRRVKTKLHTAPVLAVPPKTARDLMPILRGIIGDRLATYSGNRDHAMPIFTLRTGLEIDEFLARSDLQTLATRGVATPDHVIHTKNIPLLLSAQDIKAGQTAINRVVDAFIASYTTYFDTNAARPSAPKTMIAPTPNLIWAEGVGIIGIGQDASAASIAGDLAEQNIAAMDMGQAGGGFFPVGSADLFDMEYWSLEQAKLNQNTPPFAGKIVLVTGAGGAIGMATAQAFANLGANLFMVDLETDALDKALAQLGPHHGGIALDVTTDKAAQTATNACIEQFGGLDILISNAGAAWTGEMSTLDDAVLRKSFELNFFAHQAFAKAAAQVFETQGRSGQILFNVSKQAVNPGKGFGAYGLPKAATFFLLRQLALELGPAGVRVNGINADRIRSGLLDDAFIAKRAKARGVAESTYMAGNLIQREVQAHHVADAFVALARCERTTAHVMTVDGGNIEAALR